MKRQTFLQELGRRLRQARERASLSVTALADDAGVSRRYVTEAEAGRANLSVLKLAELARALRVPLASLVDHPLDAHGGERVALVGLRGAGKSTVGRALALELEAPFVELDQRVEELAGLPLSAVFDLHGVEGYRRFESEALERVLAEGERVVIATGGSIVTAPATFERLRSACRTVWLSAKPEDHFQRVVAQGDARPMRGRPRAMEELARLLAEREPAYAKCDVTLDTSGREVPELVLELCERLEQRS
ncbi:MAG: helix-turn-helix domain-containing protein [Planctomycetes bacterium]|nr:helix-turn-helix domain-containing protein [Planctomycetota bacterium]